MSIEKKRRGRKRIYRDNAERSRAWRLKKKLERAKAYGNINSVRAYTEDRELVEKLNPELKDTTPEVTETDLNNMTEDQFLEWLEANEAEGNHWECSYCGTVNPIYREECVYEGLPRPERLDEGAELFMLKYPVSRQWTQVKETDIDRQKREGYPWAYECYHDLPHSKDTQGI